MEPPQRSEYLGFDGATCPILKAPELNIGSNAYWIFNSKSEEFGSKDVYINSML
jgi:hypothetical protein